MRPHALRDQRLLQRHRLIAAGHDGADAGTDGGFQPLADLDRCSRIATRALLDHAFDGADRKGHAAGLHALDVDRRKQVPALGQAILDRADIATTAEDPPRHCT